MPNLKSIAWCVAYRKSEDKEFCIVKNPIWGWAADPFLIERKGIMFIFAELWDYRKGKGGIGYITIQNGKIGKWKMIIEESYHLSYPHFVEIDNQLYICPESCNNKSLYFYRCKSFPDIWEKLDPFIQDMDLSDTTFFNSGDDLYGFSCLYHENPIKLIAFKLIGSKIEFSPNNPIYRGGKLARPGGAIFKRDNKLIRVSQDCTEYYGKALIFTEVKSMWPKLEEKIIKIITIDDFKFDKNVNPIGIHTYNVCNGYEVVDLKLKRVNLINILFRVPLKLKKCLKR